MKKVTDKKLTLKKVTDKKLTLDVDALVEALNGDIDLVTFFVSWIKHRRDATAAYLELNPDVTKESAQVLGSRQLAKIDRVAVMKSYGLGLEEYFTQIKEGHGAMKWNDFTGEWEADHRTRLAYNDKLGRLLGVETGGYNTAVQVNIGEMGVKITQYDPNSIAP